MIHLDSKQLTQALVSAAKFRDKFEAKVRIDGDGKRAWLTARGDAVVSRTELTCTGDEVFGFTTDRDDLLTLSRGAPEQLAFDLVGGRLHAAKSRTKYSLAVADACEIAEVAVQDLDPNKATLRFSGQQLQAILSPLLASMGDDENKPHMAGVLFDVDAAVTTDGHRFVCLALPENLRSEAPVFLPRPAVEFIEHHAKANLEAEVRIHLIDGRVYITVGDVYAACPGVSGTFPPYKALIPATAAWSARFSGEAFAECVEEVLSVKSTKLLPVSMQEQGGTMTVVAVGADGSAEASMKAAFSGTMMRTTFGGRHLLDAAKVLKSSESVELSRGGSFQPALLRGTASNGWDVTVLLMPRS